jgi:hypothetical protein
MQGIVDLKIQSFSELHRPQILILSIFSLYWRQIQLEEKVRGYSLTCHL